MRIFDPTPDLSDPAHPVSVDGFTPLCPQCLAPFPDPSPVAVDHPDWKCHKCNHIWSVR